MFYTKQHEWVQVTGNIATVGISAYAAEQLGDITFVELPEVDDDVTQFEELCGIESVKAASDIYSPISGTITEVNEELESAPETINSSPEEDGWIAKIEINDESELENLMDSDTYKEYVAGLE